MANPKHVEILKQGVEVWNKWREDNPDVVPDLDGININDVATASGSRLEINNTRCSLEGIDLNKAKIRDAVFVNADLLEANLNEACIDRSTFKNSNLFKAKFNHATGHKVIFTKADLMETEMNHAKLYAANFYEATLSFTKMKHSILTGACFSPSLLYDVHLQNANLSGSEFVSSSVNKCKLNDATLVSANFSDADLSDTDLSNADLKQANFEQAKVVKVIFDKSSSQKKFQGIRVATCYGSQRFKKFAQDQDYIEEFRDAHPIWYGLWFAFANCGRSFWPWACWSAAFALSFAAIFFLVLGPESFKINGPPVDSFQTMIYYSVVTFTTLGFGDVTPKTIAAAWWVMAEVVLGYIMLGGLISILANKLARRS